jgi:large subunit ribosomal protein L23
MKSAYDVLRSPIVTEKANLDKERRNCYHFVVPMKASRQEIKEAVEKVFNVKVEDVRVMIVRGKVKRIGRSRGKRPNWKKAIVQLKEGFSIDIFEGL